MGFYGEVTVSISDFDDDDVLEYAREIKSRQGVQEVDEGDEELVDLGIIYPENISVVDKEKIQFVLENYENLNLEDLENLIIRI